MRIGFVLVFLKIGLILQIADAIVECGQEGGDFNRTKLILKEYECTRKYSPQQCWVYGVKPQIMKSNALITFKLLPSLVSPFAECIVGKINQMRPDFVINYNTTAINVFTRDCITKNEACEFLRDYLVPLTCLFRRDCNKVLSDALYAFSYGDLMLAVETTKSLSCFNSTQYDIQANFFNHFTLANGLNVVQPNLCAGVDLPIDQDDDEEPEEMEDYTDDRRKGKKKDKAE